MPDGFATVLLLSAFSQHQFSWGTALHGRAALGWSWPQKSR